MSVSRIQAEWAAYELARDLIGVDAVYQGQLPTEREEALMRLAIHCYADPRIERRRLADETARLAGLLTEPPPEPVQALNVVPLVPAADPRYQYSEPVIGGMTMQDWLFGGVAPETD